MIKAWINNLEKYNFLKSFYYISFTNSAICRQLYVFILTIYNFLYKLCNY